MRHRDPRLRLTSAFSRGRYQKQGVAIGLSLGALAGSLVLGTAAAQLGGRPSLEIVSVAFDGGLANDHSSLGARISANGRYVAFESNATNLVPGDTYRGRRLLVRDRVAGATELVTRSGPHRYISISADGRFVAFDSEADDLVPGDTNGVRDMFVRDRTTGMIERISVSSQGIQANQEAIELSMSEDGRYVAFVSKADNLVPGDTNDSRDIFVRDRLRKTTERVSVSTLRAQGSRASRRPRLSSDGRYVVFYSYATNLTPTDVHIVIGHVFIRDLVTGKTERVTPEIRSLGDLGDYFDEGAFSNDGRYLTFSTDYSRVVPNDTNGVRDVFLRDRLTGTIECVSISSAGNQGNGDSWGAGWVSADGRYVAFSSDADNVVPGDLDGRRNLFVRDRLVRTTIRVELPDGRADFSEGSITPDGRFIAFGSSIDHLVPEDTNGYSDIFVLDRGEVTEQTLVLDLPRLDFGRILVGRKQTQALTLRNAGTQEVVGTIGTLTAPFALVEGAGRFALPPGQDRQVTVEFAPTLATGVGKFQGTLAITLQQPKAEEVKVPVSGESIALP